MVVGVNRSSGHSGLLPFEVFLETIAVAVHFDDVAAVSQPVEECAGESLGAGLSTSAGQRSEPV